VEQAKEIRGTQSGKKEIKLSCWVPVTQACNPQEAEIRRFTVQSQPLQIVHKTLSQKYPSQKQGWWSGSRCKP
jgi:hypothetical protein